MDNIKEIVFNNFLIKIASLFFAVVLWFYVTPIAIRDTIEVNYILPIELRNIPENMMVIGKFEDRINVRLKGRQNIVRDIDPGQLSVSLDLSKVKEGERFFTLDHSNINVPSNTNIDIVRIEPKKIRIDVVKSIKKDVKVEISIAGKPAPGYKVKDISVNPPQVTVEGAEAELRGLSRLYGPTIDITGRKSSLSKEIRIETHLHNVRIIGKGVVVVEVEINKL